MGTEQTATIDRLHRKIQQRISRRSVIPPGTFLDRAVFHVRQEGELKTGIESFLLEATQAGVLIDISLNALLRIASVTKSHIEEMYIARRRGEELPDLHDVPEGRRDGYLLQILHEAQTEQDSANLQTLMYGQIPIVWRISNSIAAELVCDQQPHKEELIDKVREGLGEIAILEASYRRQHPELYDNN